MANKTALDWRSVSEVCFGLIVTNRLDMSKFNASMFCDGYEDAFAEWFKSKNKTTVAKKLGADYEVAIQAAGTISDESANDVEWHKILRRAGLNYQLGEKAERISKRLKQGYEIDSQEAVEIAGAFKDVANPECLGLSVSNTIDVDEFEPTELTGYLPVDLHLGGMVQSGNILVMGTTGVGKSLFTQQFWGHWLDTYKDRKIAVWSLEMTNQQYLYRGLKLFPKFRKAHEEGRVLVSDKTTTIYDIGIEAASAGVDAIVVDYIDYLVRGEPSEGKFAEIYIEMNNISRNLHIPFMMILQPNRQSYTGGVPKMYHARYSGMAENVSAQFWVTYRPKNEEDTDGDFTFVDDSMYLVAWKQRFGWMNSGRSDELRDMYPGYGFDGRGRKGPGAIVLPITKNIWSDEPGEWLVHGDIPQSMKKSRRGDG